MIVYNVGVSTEFKDGETTVEIEGLNSSGVYVVQTSTPGNFVIAGNNSLKIRLFHGNESQDPKDGVNLRYYIKLKSKVKYDFDISQDEKGWIIKEKCCLLSCAPILVSRLPRKLNIWPVRLILLPFELAWMGIKFPVTFVKYAVKVISYNLYLTHLENVNITVGSEEG